MHRLKSLLFNIDIPSGKPAPGTLLVAEPFLDDSYFNHAVIALTEYASGSQSMGMVLNSPTSLSLSDLSSDFVTPEPVRVFCGGPMSHDRLYYIHSLGDDIIPESHHIGQGLWIGGDFSSMVSYVNSGYPTEGLVRFFVGYSGWEAGQLDQELSDHVWAVTPPMRPDIILSMTGDSGWHKAVRSLGPAFRGWTFHPKHTISN